MKKQTTPLFKMLTAVLLLAVAAYFGVQIYAYATDPMTTAYLYESSAVDSVVLNGVLIRDEEVLQSSNNTLYHVRTEGERVGIGQAVAVEYPSADALTAVEAYRTKELQLEQLAFALESYLDGDAALKMDDTIRTELLSLRREVSGGDYTVAEEDLASLKAAIMKRDYTYTSKDDMEQRINTLKEELTTLKASLSNARDITADRSAIYSAECDGYESVLTPDTLDTLTASTLGTIKPTGVESNVGKLIYGDRWYYAAALSEADAHKLEKMDKLTMRFTKGLDRNVTMTVDELGDVENGKRLLILHSDKYLSATTLLRRQSAEIVLKEYTGLRVPANALRVNEDGVSGVYCVAGQTACFKPVAVVYQGDNFVLARAVDGANDKRTLRVGDEVIITRGELYDDMVIS